MPPNPFSDKAKKPDDRLLAEALGDAYKLWAEIRKHVAAEHGEAAGEWKFYGAKYGWTMKALLKKRNLFFFTPHEGTFNIGFVFGDKAVAMIEKSGLPGALIEEVRAAKKYAEGRGLRIEVRTRRDVEHIKKLIAVKVAS
jgi:hypothetical protein